VDDDVDSGVLKAGQMRAGVDQGLGRYCQWSGGYHLLPVAIREYRDRRVLGVRNHDGSAIHRSAREPRSRWSWPARPIDRHVVVRRRRSSATHSRAAGEFSLRRQRDGQTTRRRLVSQGKPRASIPRSRVSEVGGWNSRSRSARGLPAPRSRVSWRRGSASFALDLFRRWFQSWRLVQGPCAR
jgi:hypothetical protein